MFRCNRPATTHIKRQLTSDDYSFQFEKATTLIERQLTSGDNSYQAIPHINQNSYQKFRTYIEFIPNNSLEK